MGPEPVQQFVGGESHNFADRVARHERALPLIIDPYPDKWADDATTSSSSERMGVCMPCSRVSSDSVARGLVTSVQRRYGVWGRLAQSGGIWAHTGRLSARCLWAGPFPAAPGPNRTGTFQRIRLSSGCHVQFAAGFRLPWARRIPVTVSAFCVTHTSWHPVILQPPGPLRPAGGFPALPGGALLPRLLRGLCHRGTRVR
jgi:hypothetical protein